MLKTICLLLFVFQTSIFTLHFTDAAGNNVALSTYQGKKILLVNIATGSSRTNQIGELQQLQQQYPDSLVVIAFPSNSFSHEAREDSAIQQYCSTVYGVTYPIAQKAAVKGTAIQTVYNWLGNKSENGISTGEVIGDFQKFLIDETGNMVGIFSPTISPLDSTIAKAINTNYQQ